MGICSGTSNKNAQKLDPSKSIGKFDQVLMKTHGKIQDEYTVGGSIGEGSFGRVFEAMQKSTGDKRAIKELKKKQLEGNYEEILKEVNILKTLQHPNILKIYEVYEDKFAYYIVTEYLTGGELLDKIEQQKLISEQTMSDYIKTILQAISYCNSQQIIHRDLKPENILFNNKESNQVLKIIDFGLSKRVKPGETLRQLAGTPYYIAPEIIQGEYDKKCDIWSIGVILFFLLTGELPFDGQSIEEIFGKIKQNEPNYNTIAFNSISQDAKDLLKLMLKKSPGERISCEDALKHAWIQKNTHNTPLNQKILKQISCYQRQTRLKSAIQLFISYHLTQSELQNELIEQFKIIDKNNDGEISKDEFRSIYQQYQMDHLNQDDIDKIFNSIDVNQDGNINYNEFLATHLSQGQEQQLQTVSKAFDYFDINKDGTIDRKELQSILGTFDDNVWKELLDQCDANRDGTIQKNEFIQLLSQKKY